MNRWKKEGEWMLKIRDKVGIVCCSNAQQSSYKIKIDALLYTLKIVGLQPICSEFIYEKCPPFSGTGKERATALMNFYTDKTIKAIFDISGGDLANELLPLLEYEIIRNNSKPFFGYSDLTTIINAIYAKTGNISYLYQIKNLIYDCKERQIAYFQDSLINVKEDLFKFNYKFLQGNKMKGVVIGGNIRCFLKLAGTQYMPSFDNKILFLESYGGEVSLMVTYLNQFKQMNAFDKVAGVLLGTYTAMEANKCVPTIEELVLNVVENKKLPIAKTYDVGHGNDSKCIIIGKGMELLE